MQKEVELFMRAGGQIVRESPTADIPAEEKALRIELMYEELMGTGELVDSIHKGNIVRIADGIADLLYVVLGTAAAFGLNAQDCFYEAHRSNLTKLVWDEKTEQWTTIKSETGKILKPEGYKPPDFASVVRSQIADAKKRELGE